jgi:UDP-N-acetylmuramoylalanine--D-glutamate ligase
VLGLGVTGSAVVAALVGAGSTVVVVDDHPRDAQRRAADSLGVDLIESPTNDELRALCVGVDVVYPSPGVPDRHTLFAVAADAGVDIESEFDLAARLDDRPVVAITGTDGKTTVTSMVASMLLEADIPAIEAGNTEVPLVSAIAEPEVEWFVVEASSFRLGHSRSFAPKVSVWLNFGADHLDVHDSLERYRLAKSSMWARLGDDDTAIGNIDDPVVSRHHEAGTRARTVTFGLADGADYTVVDGVLTAYGTPIVSVAEMARSLPHDVANALAASAAAHEVGAELGPIAEVLRRQTPPPHRIQLVGAIDGAEYYDDSKATAPHATLAAVAGFESVVLLAGGRNKGLDLSVLAQAAPRLRGVVAFGEARAEVAAAFGDTVPVRVAEGMDDAVAAARVLAQPGDVVVLSPGCASFDAYSSYAARGDDFSGQVRTIEGAAR